MVGLMQTRMYSLACATVFLPAVCYAGRTYLLHFLLFSVLPFPSRANNYALKYLRYFSAVFLFCLPTLLFLFDFHLPPTCLVCWSHLCILNRVHIYLGR